MLIKITHRRLDHAGMTLSLLCALHCSLLPLLLTSLPLWGLGFLANEFWEFAMIGSSFLIGCFSLFKGYRQTRSVTPLLILASGFVFFFCAQFLVNERYEWMPMVAGGLLVATAHFKNWKLVHQTADKQACCADNRCPVS